MEPKLECIGECWFFNVRKILELRKELGGFFGYYDFYFEDDKLTEAKIRYIKIKPFLWKKVLKHEMGHHQITQNSKSLDEAVERNIEYDEVTKHGILQWKAKELPYWGKQSCH